MVSVNGPISVAVAFLITALVAPSLLTSLFSIKDEFPPQEVCAEHKEFDNCTQKSGCNWCQTANYGLGFQEFEWGWAPPRSTSGGRCLSTSLLQIRLENLYEEESSFLAEFPGEVTGCFKNLSDNGKENAMLNYDLDVCQDIPYIFPRTGTWLQTVGEDSAYGVKCYGSRRDFLSDKSWCISSESAIGNAPESVKGLWWIDGSVERVIAFCGGNGAWDAATNTLYLDLWRSWTFEDSTFGRHSGERMRKLQGRLKIHYEFEDDSQTKVRRAYLILRGTLRNFVRQLLHEQAGTMIPNPAEDQSFNATGLGSADVFYVKQLYTQNGKETHHVHDFLRNVEGTNPPMKDKLWRYTSEGRHVQLFSFYIVYQLEIALFNMFEVRDSFGTLVKIIILMFWLQVSLPPLLTLLGGAVLLLLPERSLKKLSMYMRGTDDTQSWTTWLYAAMVLAWAIMIDAAGDASYLMPGLGELSDAIWAPIAAWLIRKIFNSPVSAAITFLKEITFLDAIPTATITWVIYHLPLMALGLRRSLCKSSSRQRDTAFLAELAGT